MDNSKGIPLEFDGSVVHRASAAKIVHACRDHLAEVYRYDSSSRRKQVQVVAFLQPSVYALHMHASNRYNSAMQ